MIIDRQKQRQFLQDELKKQTDEFKNKLESSAQDLLLDKHELFVAIFIKYMENGEMLLNHSYTITTIKLMLEKDSMLNLI